MWTQDAAYAFLKEKGKGYRINSSGKEFDRRTNPKDCQGNIMRCLICDNNEHFAARSPQGKGRSRGKGQDCVSSGSSLNGRYSMLAGFMLSPGHVSGVQCNETDVLTWMNNAFELDPLRSWQEQDFRQT